MNKGSSRELRTSIRRARRRRATELNLVSMIDVLTRHFPALAPSMKGIESAFHPWNVTR